MPDFIALTRDVLEKGRSVRFQVWGSSMTPFIKDGDVITIVPVSAESDIGLGKVVAFLHPWLTGRRLVVHRVVGRRGSSFLIRPDHALGHDPFAYKLCDILGRVVRVEISGTHYSSRFRQGREEIDFHRR